MSEMDVKKLYKYVGENVRLTFRVIGILYVVNCHLNGIYGDKIQVYSPYAPFSYINISDIEVIRVLQ